MVDVLTQSLAASSDEDPYDLLPICVRQYYSREAWLWLSDQQKTDLILHETEPEC
jgi:hypothetical protein